MTRTCVTRTLAWWGWGVLVLAACSSSPAAPDAGSRSDAALRDGGPVDASTAIDGSPGDAGVSDSGGDAGSSIDALVDVLEHEPDAERIDATLREVSWGEGWPLREVRAGGARWLFATRWDDAGAAVSLASDVNGWSTVAHPASRGASGVHWFVVVDEADFVTPAVGAKYKWWGQGDVYRAPPEATAYGYDEFGEHGWVAPPLDAPHLERFPALRSAFLETPRAVRAWLPAGFVAHGAAAARARALLLHDGQNVFDPGAFYGGWRVDEALADGGWDDVVAIAVDNAPDRMSAYTHVEDLIGGTSTGGRAADYLRMIEEEVLPFARARYGISARGRSLMISGSSLGGLVSLWIASVRPELAGCVAAFSSTLGWGSIGRSGGEDTLIARWSGHPALSIYLDSGGGPGTGCVDADGDGIEDDGDHADNYCENVQMVEVLRANGFTEGVDLHYVWEPDAPHAESAWRVRFPAALGACAAFGWAGPS